MTKLERLMLANQLLILERLAPDEAECYAPMRKALIEGYSLHYEDALQMFHDDLPEEQCREVLDVLAMYRAITNTIAKLKPDDELRDHYRARFPGFDGNNEGALMGYVRYFIVDLDRYEELRYGADNPSFNSHAPMLPAYRKMLTDWKGLGQQHEMTRDDLTSVLGPTP